MRHGFTLLFFFLSFSVLAQRDFRPGFVVTASADTLRGLVHFRENRRETCLFKANAGAAVQRFSVETARSYGFANDRTYEALTIRPDSAGPEKRVFAWVLVRGRAELFEVDQRFYARKAGEVFTLRTRMKDVYVGNRWYKAEDREYERLLATFLLADCPTIQLADGGGVAYSNYALTRLFEVYNRCTNSTLALPTSAKPWVKWEWTAYAGAGSQSLHLFTLFPFKNGTEGRINSGFVPVLGLQGGFSSPRMNERFSAHLGLFYSQFLLSGTQEITRNDILDRSDFFLRVRSVQVPLLVRYRVPMGHLNPFLQGGIATRFNRSLSAWYQTETEAMGVVSTTRAELAQLKSAVARLVVGAGVHANLRQHIRLNAEARYEFGGGDALDGDGPFGGNSFSSLTFLLGIGLW